MRTFGSESLLLSSDAPVGGQIPFSFRNILTLATGSNDPFGSRRHPPQGHGRRRDPKGHVNTGVLLKDHWWSILSPFNHSRDETEDK